MEEKERISTGKGRHAIEDMVGKIGKRERDRGWMTGMRRQGLEHRDEKTGMRRQG
jgi:hypothetical protein